MGWLVITTDNNIYESKCENCGSTHLTQENNTITCQACGSKFYIKKETTTPAPVSPPPQPQPVPQQVPKTQNQTSSWDCCKGFIYFLLAVLLYMYITPVTGPWVAMFLSVILTILLAYGIHKIFTKK